MLCMLNAPYIYKHSLPNTNPWSLYTKHLELIHPNTYVPYHTSVGGTKLLVFDICHNWLNEVCKILCIFFCSLPKFEISFGECSSMSRVHSFHSKVFYVYKIIIKKGQHMLAALIFN